MKEAFRGALNERGESVKGHGNIAAGVSGNKLEKGMGHQFASGLSNISGSGASYPGSV